jgi:hypothetical protein
VRRAPKRYASRSALHPLYWLFFTQLLQEAFVRIKNGKREEEPGDALIIMLPVFAMAALIGILALLMRSTGKW